MNTLSTASSQADKKIDGSRPRNIETKDIERDRIGCENEFEIKDGMSRSDALIVAFRILWCEKIGSPRRRLKPKDIVGLVAAVNRTAAGSGHSDSVTIRSLLARLIVYRGEDYVRDLQMKAESFQKPIVFRSSAPFMRLAAAG